MSKTVPKTLPPPPKRPLCIFLVEKDPLAAKRLYRRLTAEEHATRFALIGVSSGVPIPTENEFADGPIDAVIFDPDLFPGLTIMQIVLEIWKAFDRDDRSTVELVVHNDRWSQMKADYADFGVTYGFVREYSRLETILSRLAAEREAKSSP